MTFRVAAAVVLLLCICGLGFAATHNRLEMEEAVAAKLPERDRFEPLGWTLPKIIREYRRLYPTGRVLWRGAVLMAMMFACFAIGAGLLGSPPAAAWVSGVGAVALWFVYFRRPRIDAA